MLIKRKSILTKKTNVREIEMTDDEYSQCLSHDFKNIDQILPHLNEDDKEFLASGVVPEEWKDLKLNAIGGTK